MADEPDSSGHVTWHGMTYSKPAVKTVYKHNVSSLRLGLLGNAMTHILPSECISSMKWLPVHIVTLSATVLSYSDLLVNIFGRLGNRSRARYYDSVLHFWVRGNLGTYRRSCCIKYSHRKGERKDWDLSLSIEHGKNQFGGISESGTAAFNPFQEKDCSS